MLDHQVHQAHQEPLATLKQVNLVPQVAQENQVPLAHLVIRVQLEQLELWVPEAPLVHLEPPDLPDLLL